MVLMAGLNRLNGWVECQGEGNTKSHLNIQAGAAAQFRAQVAM